MSLRLYVRVPARGCTYEYVYSLGLTYVSKERSEEGSRRNRRTKGWRGLATRTKSSEPRPRGVVQRNIVGWKPKQTVFSRLLVCEVRVSLRTCCEPVLVASVVAALCFGLIDRIEYDTSGRFEFSR